MAKQCIENRPCLYKAWEHNLKEIIPVHSLDLDYSMINKESVWRYFSEVTLMQFTGLYDSTDERIFEFEIGWDAFREIYGVVRFDEGKFVYEEGNICHDLAEVCDDIEIVGNVFENSNLLWEE